MKRGRTGTSMQLHKTPRNVKNRVKCRDCRAAYNVPKYIFRKASPPRCMRCGGILDVLA